MRLKMRLEFENGIRNRFCEINKWEKIENRIVSLY